MCERNAFYIQASCLCLEANSLRDSEQSAANILTIYQVTLSQSETGFPSSHQLKSYVASKSRPKLAARAVLLADAGLLVITANMQSETGFPSSHQLKFYVASKSRLKLAARAVQSADASLLVYFNIEPRLK